MSTSSDKKTGAKPAAKRPPVKRAVSPYGPPVTPGLRKMRAPDREQHARSTTEQADLWALVGDSSPHVRQSIMDNPAASSDVLAYLLMRTMKGSEQDPYVVHNVFMHPNCPPALRQRLALKALSGPEAVRTFGYNKNSRWHKTLEILGPDSLTEETLAQLGEEWSARVFVVQFTHCPLATLARALDPRTSEYETENKAVRHPRVTPEIFLAAREAVIADEAIQSWAPQRMQRLTELYNEAHPTATVEPLAGVRAGS